MQMETRLSFNDHFKRKQEFYGLSDHFVRKKKWMADCLKWNESCKNKNFN